MSDLETLQAALDKAREAHAVTGEACTVAYDAVQAEVNRLVEQTEGVTSENVLLLLMEADHNGLAHKRLKEFVADLPGLWEFGYFGSNEDRAPVEGMWGYAGVKFLPEKSANMAEVEDSIRTFMKVFDGYTINKEGLTHIDFMENSLSEYGSYGIEWKSVEDAAVLTKHVYGSRKEVFKGSLLEVLEYVQKHHWYGEPTSRHDEDYY